MHFTAEHWQHFYPLNKPLLLSHVHFTAIYKIYIVFMHSNSIPWTVLNFAVLQIADCQCTAMYWTALLPYTALHKWGGTKPLTTSLNPTSKLSSLLRKPSKG